MVERNVVVLNLASPLPGLDRYFRLKIKVKGEVVEDCKPEVGFSHKGLEKTAESMIPIQMPFLASKIDSSSGISGEVAYSIALESALSLKVPERANAIRVVLMEISRIASHLGWLSNFSLAVGFVTCYHYAQRDRERALRFIEILTGSRISPNFCVPGGIKGDIKSNVIFEFLDFLTYLDGRMPEFDLLLTDNKFFRGKVDNIGRIQREHALTLGLTGPNLRACGERMDIRKIVPYCGYENLNFKVPVGRRGDCFDRYQVRMKEIRESSDILKGILSNMPDGDVYIKPLIDVHSRKIEEYARVECPHGELGIFIKYDLKEVPTRFKVRTPSLVSVSLLRDAIINQRVSDVGVIVSSFDICLSEVDR